MNTYDKLWKGIIEEQFEDFLHFFFSEWTHLIDFDKGFRFLDQELAQLFPELKSDNRSIDKLVQVFLKDGKEEWFLIHIEVQGYSENNFEKRAFVYNYRIFDRYQKDITALVIFTDKKKGYQPDTYQTKCLGTTLTYQFNTFKVIDQDKKELEQSNNPFAIVVLATLEAIKKGSKGDDVIMKTKHNLVKMLYAKGYEKSKIISIFNFIQYYVRFENSENYHIFAEEVSSIYEKNHKNMGVVDILLEDAHEEGIKKGIDLGIEKGIDLGIEKGIDLGIEKGIDLGIEKGIDLGIEKGIDLGIEKGLRDVIQNILVMYPDWSDEKIAGITNAPIAMVESMRKKS